MIYSQVHSNKQKVQVTGVMVGRKMDMYIHLSMYLYFYAPFIQFVIITYKYHMYGFNSDEVKVNIFYRTKAMMFNIQ